jgi:hypothetical protein
VIEIGREAGRRWNLSASHGDAGDANAIVALVHAQRTMEFDATVERKKDDTAEAFTFNVVDLATPYYNADGSKDTRKMAARTACLAERLFDIATLTNAIKQRIARAVKIAIYIINSTADMSDDVLFDSVKLKGSNLVVPHELVRAEPNETASDNERAFYEAMKGKALVLDGKDKASLAELSRRANPPKSDRAAGEQKDKGASFVSSVDYITAVVAQQLDNGADESDIGLNNDARMKLFKLAQNIAAYFAADPLEETEVEPATGTNN